jgi:hypothetical protein
MALLRIKVSPGGCRQHHLSSTLYSIETPVSSPGTWISSVLLLSLCFQHQLHLRLSNIVHISIDTVPIEAAARDTPECVRGQGTEPCQYLTSDNSDRSKRCIPLHWRPILRFHGEIGKCGFVISLYHCTPKNCR